MVSTTGFNTCFYLISSIFKMRIDKNGKEIISQREELASKKDVVGKDNCGPCYGGDPPPSGCCNSCDDVRDAYARKGWGLSHLKDIKQCVSESQLEEFHENEGCKFYGNIAVNKVAGNFHFAPGHSFQASNMHVHDVNGIMEHLGEIDFSHVIEHLSFGNHYEGVINPLDNYKKLNDDSVVFQYYVKVVPTVFNYLNGSVLLTNQYSVTQYQKGSLKGIKSLSHMPGVFFK
jgi:hypothetical protein